MHFERSADMEDDRRNVRCAVRQCVYAAPMWAARDSRKYLGAAVSDHGNLFPTACAAIAAGPILCHALLEGTFAPNGAPHFGDTDMAAVWYRLLTVTAAARTTHTINGAATERQPDDSITGDSSFHEYGSDDGQKVVDSTLPASSIGSRTDDDTTVGVPLLTHVVIPALDRHYRDVFDTAAFVRATAPNTIRAIDATRYHLYCEASTAPTRAKHAARAESLVNLVARNGGSLRSLILPRLFSFTHEAVSPVKRMFGALPRGRLESLDFNGLHLDLAAWAHLGPSLRRLEGVKIGSRGVPTFVDLAAAMPSLRHLKVSVDADRTADGFDALMVQLESLVLTGSGTRFLPTFLEARAPGSFSSPSKGEWDAAEDIRVTPLRSLLSLSVALSDDVPTPALDAFVKDLLDRAPNVQELVLPADVALRRVAGVVGGAPAAALALSADAATAVDATAVAAAAAEVRATALPTLLRLTAECVKDGIAVTDPELQEILTAAPQLRYLEIRRLRNFLPFVCAVTDQRAKLLHGPLYRDDMWVGYRHAALRQLVIRSAPWAVFVAGPAVTAFELAAVAVCPRLRLAAVVSGN